MLNSRAFSCAGQHQKTRSGIDWSSIMTTSENEAGALHEEDGESPGLSAVSKMPLEKR